MKLDRRCLSVDSLRSIDRVPPPIFKQLAVLTGYPDNSPPGQFAPDNSPPIFKQLASCSFIASLRSIDRVSRQLAPDLQTTSSIDRVSRPLAPIFKQLASRFIYCRAKRAAKYMNPRLNVIQIILSSFIHYQTNYSSFFYSLPNVKIGGELSGANCPRVELSQGVLDWTTSTRLSTSTIFEFQTSDVVRALVLHVGLG